MNTPTQTAPPGAASPDGRGPLQPSGDADGARERAIALLTDRYAEGALDDEALERYLERLYAATGAQAVDVVVAELSAARPPAPYRELAAAPAAPTAARRRILAIMSESKRAGRWVVPPELTVVAVMSDVKLDLRDAVLPPVTVIDTTAFMASVKLTVPPGLPVTFEVDSFMGTAVSAAVESETRSQGPVVRVVGTAFMGEVRVILKERKAR